MIITDINELTQPCKEVSIFEAMNIISQLEKELAQERFGIGLAAPQISIHSTVAIIRMPQLKIDLINPIIVKEYDLMEYEGEACLSFPDQSILTKRYAEIVVEDSVYTAGRIFTGLEAVVVAHEIDHLNSKTMFDYKIERPKVNQKCWCGSGVKYKRCHMKKVIKV